MRPSHAPGPAGDQARGPEPKGDGPPGWVVEMFGLPGSGKSRLADELVRASAELGLRLDRPSARVAPDVPAASRITRKLGLAAGEVARRPARSSAAARAIVRSQRGGLPAGARRWFHWLVMQRLLSSARDTPGAHLFEEGVLQALWSVGLRGDVGQALERVAAVPTDCALPDLVLVIHAPIEVLDRRLSARASRHSRLQKTSDARARRDELGRGLALERRIQGWWTERFGDAHPVIHIDNGGEIPLEKAAASTAARIARLLGERDRGRGRS